MSCGCGKGTFSSQRNTWSRQSDLGSASWDPYPELQNPKNCYGSNEPYCNCSRGLFKVEQNRLDANYVPLQQSVFTGGRVESYCNCSMGDYKIDQTKSKFKPLQRSVVVGSTMAREYYDTPCCRPTPYNNLDQTWGSQKPYNL